MVKYYQTTSWLGSEFNLKSVAVKTLQLVYIRASINQSMAWTSFSYIYGLAEISLIWQKHEGSPLGSMVDFACDVDGSPILALDSFAFHIKACTSKDISCFFWAFMVKNTGN